MPPAPWLPAHAASFERVWSGRNIKYGTWRSPSLWMLSMSAQSFASNCRKKPRPAVPFTRGSAEAWQCGQRANHMALRVCESEFTSRSARYGGSDDAVKGSCSARTSATTCASAAPRAAGAASPHAACFEPRGKSFAYWLPKGAKASGRAWS